MSHQRQRTGFLRRALAFFLPAAVVAVLGSGLVYASVQHIQRSDANDPQVQLAEDAAVALDAGAQPAGVVGQDRVDVGVSLAPFVVVYDTAGSVLATSGRLDGHDPVPPAGVLESAVSTGRDIVTWQPRGGVRIATVVVPWHGGAVLAGRSLRLVEQREDDSLLLVVAGLLVMLLGIALASLVAAWLWPAEERAVDAAQPALD